MDPNCPDAAGRDEEREEQMDAGIPEVAVRDMEKEIRMLQIIAGCARAPKGQEHLVTEENLLSDEDFASQFLNESGQGVEEEEICRAEEVPLTNSGEVYYASVDR